MGGLLAAHAGAAWPDSNPLGDRQKYETNQLPRINAWAVLWGGPGVPF